jgi:hypothetical protein
MPNTALILHVKGTVDETTTLPKQTVRTAIAEGKLSRSQLIWSPEHNAWKQVRELPHLWPSQKLAPAPTPRVATDKLPRLATGALPRMATGTGPRIAAASQPVVAHSPENSQAAVQGRSSNYKVSEEPHFNPLKWLCLGLMVLILGAVGFNFIIIEQPLLSGMSQTSYSDVMVYAHLGGFVQKNAMVIHILGSGSLNKSNLTDFLVTLARNTPQQTGIFERISLTSGLMGQYTISGSAWKEFGDMKESGETQQKEFLLNQLEDASGQPLLLLNSTMTAEAQRAEHEKIWAGFAASFTRS